MATVEERVANLEARVDEHARGLNDLRAAVVHLEERIDRRFDGVDARFGGLEQRFTELHQRLSSLDDRFSRYFVWMLGGQVSTLAALVVILARD